MKNRAIIDMMEPGSTFKIVTAAAALNERKVRPDSTIFCENGVWTYGGNSCSTTTGHGYGELSVQDILVQIEQHRRGQARAHPRRAEVLRIHPAFRIRRAHRYRVAGRDQRIDSSAASVEQDLHHAHPDGPRGWRHAIANDAGHGGDREWREIGHARGS